MTDCATCNTKKVVTKQPQLDELCDTIVHETVCVQGTVIITPDLIAGPSSSFCVGNPIIGSCPGPLVDTCQFTVSQNICVQIPLTFSASATAQANGVVCGTPQTGPCTGETACTRTIGYYKNNPVVTNLLIMNAGGSILLGNGLGLSFNVTTANADAVLDFNTPSPPAPEDPPFAQQYQVLYAQLLAAKLNVLRLTAEGTDICNYALNAIMAADNFLGDSPAGGTDGAGDIQSALELFNAGNAPGCPTHCD